MSADAEKVTEESTRLQEEEAWRLWIPLLSAMVACVALNAPLVAAPLKRAQLRSPRNVLLAALGVCDVLQCALQLARWLTASLLLLIPQISVELLTSDIILAVVSMKSSEEAQIPANTTAWRGVKPTMKMMLFAALGAVLLSLLFLAPNPFVRVAQEVFTVKWMHWIVIAILILVRTAPSIIVVVKQWRAPPRQKYWAVFSMMVRLMGSVLSLFAMSLAEVNAPFTVASKVYHVLVVSTTILNPLVYVERHSDLANMRRTFFPNCCLNPRGSDNVEDYPLDLEAPLPDGVIIQLEQQV